MWNELPNLVNWFTRQASIFPKRIPTLLLYLTMTSPIWACYVYILGVVSFDLYVSTIFNWVLGKYSRNYSIHGKNALLILTISRFPTSSSTILNQITWLWVIAWSLQSVESDFLDYYDRWACRYWEKGDHRHGTCLFRSLTICHPFQHRVDL